MEEKVLNIFWVILINRNIIISPPIIANTKLILYKKKTPQAKIDKAILQYTNFDMNKF